MTPRPRRLALLAGALLLGLATAPHGAPARAEDPPLRTPPDRPVDVRRIALDLAVDLEARAVEGTATLDLVALTRTRTVLLDAVDHEVVRVERLRGQDAQPLAFTNDGRTLELELALIRDEAAAVRVTYRVREPKEGLHFFGPTPDSPDTPWQVWSQGEPQTNRHWFPCVDHPDERQQTALTARVKPGLTVISNGTHLGTAREGDRDVWRFAQEREHVSYLVTLVVGTFDIERDTWRGKPLAYYVPRGRKADIPRSFARTKDMLDFFSDLTGVEYPWPKYEQVVVEQFEAGGMENTGATTLNEFTLHDERAHLDYSSEGLVAHELAHQWFGDLLTCRDWAHIWINESFATWGDAVWHEHAHGADEYAVEMLGNADRGIGAGKQRPIVDRRWASPDAMFDGRAYPKGAAVIHQLRAQLGPEDFLRGLRLFVARATDRSVETDDLRRALEDATGRNLERYFHDWVHRPGNPVLDVRLERDAARGVVVVTVKQTQPGEPYRLPVEVALRAGEQDLRQEVLMDGREARLVFATTAAPSRFRFDPREQLILAERTVHVGRDLWLAALREDDAFGRLRAARALGHDHAPEVTDALGRALAEDPFWGVRDEAAAALGRHPGDRARDALVAALRADHPKVRRAAADALAGRGRDPKAGEALAAVLAGEEPSYYVLAAALRAYGRAVDDPKAALLRLLGLPSHNEVVRQAALDGLADLDDPAVLEPLRAHLALRHPYVLRQAAARAVGRAASRPGVTPEVRRAVVDELAAMLRAASRRGRRAALDGLRALGREAEPALGAIDAVAQADPIPRIREQAAEVARRVREGAPPDAQLARLREQLRRLEEGRGALEDRLGKLEEAQRAKAAAEGEKR